MSFVYRRGRLKGQRLLRLLISLFILTVFVPEVSQTSQSVPARVSISRYGQNCALLPVPSPASDDLCRARRHESDAFGRTITTVSALASFGAEHCFVPHLDAVPRWVNGFFDTIYRWGFRQACQLLDLPPPSASVSAVVQDSA